jgi:cell division GTPase FtsZ
MRVAAIGVGGAGGRVIDALYEQHNSQSLSYLSGVSVLDTDRAELSELEGVPDDSKTLFGQVETGGTGSDGNQAQATAAIEDDLLEVRRAADSAIRSNTAAIILVAGLGGGTGSAVSPQLAKALQEVYDRPVYAVSILPATHEEVPRENPSKSLQALDKTVDAQIIFDNDTWLTPDTTLEDVADELNDVLSTRLDALFAAGEATSREAVGQRVVDASEIIATLNEGGLATLGYAQQTLNAEQQLESPSLAERIRNWIGSSEETVDEIDAIKRVEATLRQAAQRKLTLDCSLDAATSGLLIVSGPPEWLSQSAISDGQNWLSEQTGSVQIRNGDNPVPGGSEISVLILLGGIRDTPRIQSLMSLKN